MKWYSKRVNTDEVQKYLRSYNFNIETLQITAVSVHGVLVTFWGKKLPVAEDE